MNHLLSCRGSLERCFITICTTNREWLFGDVAESMVKLNEFGKIAHEFWQQIPHHFPFISLDRFVVMPNHIHGILLFNANEILKKEEFGKPVSGSFSTIIRSYKSAVTYDVNKLRNSRGEDVWQKGFYNHCIENNDELMRIRKYISNNPKRWSMKG